MRLAPRLLIYALLVLGTVLTFGPFYWMVVSSLKPQGEIFTATLKLIPSNPTLEHYHHLVTRTGFVRWTFNSIVFALGTTALSLFFSSHLTFVLNPIYVIALVLTAIAVWQITGDGKAVMFEGLALVALYVVVATLAFYE